MAHVTIPDQDSYVTYASQTGTGPFVVPFAIFEKADLVVLVDGTDIGQAGFSYSATSSTTGGFQTGTITLSSSITSKDVTIYRQINPKRTTDLGQGPQSRDAVNSAFDRSHALHQDSQRDFERSLRLPIGSTQPELVPENGTFLGWAAGQIANFINVSVTALNSAWQTILTTAPGSGWATALGAALGSGWSTVLAQPVSGPLREKLSGLRTYYVRSDGSDSNTGLVDSAGGAFLTLQKAADVIYETLDLNGNNVIVDIGNGTYTAGVSVSGAPVGEGLIYFIGDTTTPSNVLVSVTGGDCFSAFYGARFDVRGVKLQTTTSGHGLKAYLGSHIGYQSVDFGACAEMHVECGQGSTIIADGAYTISGGALGHLHCGSFGLISSSTFTVTLTGTPAFSSYFAGAAQGNIIVTGMTFTGSATGVRYLAHRGGVISAAAIDPALPGNAAGRVATGGVYRASVVNPFAIAPDTGLNDSVVLYSRDNDAQTYIPRIDLRCDADANGYFYMNGDDCYSSGQTHLGSATEVVVGAGTQDGFTVKSAAALAAGFYAFSASANGAAVGYMRRRTSNGDILVFQRDNTTVGSVSVTTTTTAYNVSSDGRLKDKLGLLTDVGDIIDSIEIHRFRWNHIEGDHFAVGVMAQELYKVVPEAVTPGDHDPTRRPGDEGWRQWGVDQAKLMPYVIVEQQDARKRLASLEERVHALEDLLGGGEKQLGQHSARAIVVRNAAYVIWPDDALSLVGALAMAVDGQTSRITLASGDVLELTHQDVSDIGRQLAGKPADEVSG